MKIVVFTILVISLPTSSRIALIFKNACLAWSSKSALINFPVSALNPAVPETNTRLLARTAWGNTSVVRGTLEVLKFLLFSIIPTISPIFLHIRRISEENLLLWECRSNFLYYRISYPELGQICPDKRFVLLFVIRPVFGGADRMDGPVFERVGRHFIVEDGLDRFVIDPCL